mmetsp:Transcript_30278/g.74420  ORF Transcript_30278/g.74420 Transcript_30278/m.74420 type:complete len:82 (+) Transcript_30278:47-292(+)|eukprot:CAMPEP_0206235368 /NCGR_PEP_ID=MMETSP0047_2-20121206/13110_1 /ASSEMBLY_ACC=CAM_ASM_000192 /TAXON_ID=195065 /ORGANISM="Chroomonas mesostigmatica_cf, Strain CCMP1168" /LENGTH=81 /DNA_ID=CAMNT_0053659563 /DNA_START=27 /DNA_END=272 /DNA_ORIENTATION=+
MTFETVRKVQELTDLNFFVKYTDHFTPSETFSGSNAVIGERMWTVISGAGGNTLGNPFDNGYDSGHPTSNTPAAAPATATA